MRRFKGEQKNYDSIDELIFAFIKGDESSWQALNSSLDNDDVKNLNDCLSLYLIEATAKQKRQRELALINRIQEKEKAFDAASGNPALARQMQEELKELKSSLIRMLTSQRSFGPGTHFTNLSSDKIRAFLAFEFLENVLIREKQVGMLENILSGKINEQERDFIAQLIMGAGKSKVILPLLALLMADGIRCVVLCVPKEQIVFKKNT